jgi:hypothetical protein
MAFMQANVQNFLWQSAPPQRAKWSVLRAAAPRATSQTFVADLLTLPVHHPVGWKLQERHTDMDTEKNTWASNQHYYRSDYCEPSILWSQSSLLQQYFQWKRIGRAENFIKYVRRQYTGVHPDVEISLYQGG